ncbi:PAS domain S-box protein [Rhodobacteraceae bacterium 2CG4]|uniref:histidine kinase n=1 Tax=Halovulum marinum TaxID=2662447 RepID=A0A6L5Z1J6_9RHOB|nr:PAS domain S-box protein [Halovulum marinum]MSU90368.1 PAS domain S-box protein [Halovulum marinum]
MSREGDVYRASGLEDFFENGAIALHFVSGDGMILRANRAELDLLGYSAEEYIGRHIAEVHVDQPVIDDILARLLRGETIHRYPARLRARDGSIRHVEITSSGQFIDGTFINTRCFTVDVTDLVAARQEVSRKDEFLRQILDALPAGIFMVDAAGRLTYVNKAASELVTGEPKLGEDEWHKVFRLFTPDGREIPRDQRPMSIVLNENRPVRGVEAMTQRADGSLMPVMPFPTPIRDDDGNLSGAVNMFVDMSERKQAEDMFRLAVEASSSGMILADAAGRIVLTNAAAERLFGYDRAELAGREVEDLIPPRLREEHANHRRSYAQQPEVRVMGAGRELFGLRKDGTEVPVEIGLNPLMTGQGLMVLSTIIDISERRRAAEREKLLVRELHHRSHNLFAIIRAIIERSLSGDRTLSQARAVLQSRLAAMARTYQLLNQMEWRGLNLADIVRAELEPFGNRVRIDGPDVALAPAEAQNLSLALHELATNAAKYGALSVPDGKVEVRWSLTARDGGALLRFEWRERDGPAVVAPIKQGFGSALLRQVSSEARFDFGPEGLSCRMEVPLAEPAPTSAQD